MQKRLFLCTGCIIFPDNRKLPHSGTSFGANGRLLSGSKAAMEGSPHVIAVNYQAQVENEPARVYGKYNSALGIRLL